MNTIPIFFSFDNNYVIPAAVAFYSLLNKAKSNIFYDMYVLHSDITAENQTLLINIVNKTKNAKLNFINTKNFLSDLWNNGSFNFQVAKSKFTADTIVRCFGSRFFPQYDKIIYSDVDVVFVDDISEIYNIDLQNQYIAGVKNAFMKSYSNELSHLKKEHYEMLKDSYIAGGIWVLNLKKIREDNLEQRMIEIIEDKSIIKRWNDQDIINIACENKVAFLPLNYISYPYLDDIIKTDNFTSHYTTEELYDSIINPKIIHYAAQKPWNGKPKHSEIWWIIFDYLKLPKTKIFKEEKSKTNKLKKYKKLYNLFLILTIILAILNIAVIIWLILK